MVILLISLLLVRGSTRPQSFGRHQLVSMPIWLLQLVPDLYLIFSDKNCKCLMSLGFTCFRWKKNVLCKKLFDVPLVDYGVDGIGEIFQPSELSQLSRISNFSGSPSFSSSSNSLGSPILLRLWALWALPTLWWLNWKSSKSPKPRKNGRSERVGRAGRAGRSIEIGDLRELGELGELEEPCPQSVLLPKSENLWKQFLQLAHSPQCRIITANITMSAVLIMRPYVTMCKLWYVSL